MSAFDISKREKKVLEIIGNLALPPLPKPQTDKELWLQSVRSLKALTHQAFEDAKYAEDRARDAIRSVNRVLLELQVREEILMADLGIERPSTEDVEEDPHAESENWGAV